MSGERCITCGDVGDEMTVVSCSPGVCAAADGSRHEVELSLVDARAGDRVLVHAGVALQRLEEDA
jgi:hydrogenase maturation factor